MSNKAIKIFMRANFNKADAQQAVRIFRKATTVKNLGELLNQEGISQGSSPDQYLCHRVNNIYEVDSSLPKQFIKSAKLIFENSGIPLEVIEAYVLRGGGVDSATSIVMNQGSGEKFPGEPGEYQAKIFEKIDEFLLKELKRYLFPKK
jgi:hypothetical protein